MQDRVPLYPGRVMLKPVPGQENTFDMVRADSPTQEGTQLNKANLLKDATAAMFGLGDTAVPDEILAFLGEYNQYWWQRRNISYTENQETVAKTVKVTNGDTAREVYYGDTITIGESGEISIDDPVSVRITWSGCATQSSVIQGKYVTGLYEGESLIFFVPDGVSMQYSESRVQYAANAIKAVTAVEGYGPWGYTQSSERDAHPDTGISGNYEYKYLGIPFNNAVNAVKIETGSYVGTGLYGRSHPVTLNFSKKPVLILIGTNATGSYGHFGIIIPNANRGIAFTNVGTSSSLSTGGLAVSTSGNSVSFYGESNANSALNGSEWPYVYIAVTE